MRDRKPLWIALLSASAVALCVAHLQLTPEARADNLISNDDFQLVTGKTAKDEDALYVLNKSTNLCAIFTWDTAKRSVVVRDVKSMDTVLASQ